MFYLITYATHDERYFKFLKNRVKVLGFGTEWKGFHDKVSAVVEFCSSVDPDDTVCFVDGFDSMILGTDHEILAAYKSLGHDIVFSEEKTILPTLFNRYNMDKNFGDDCRVTKLNSGLYIGKARSLINFWKDMKPGDDDQRYACSKYPYVDKEHRLFYNYSKNDTDVSIDTDGHMYKGSQKILIIGMPGNETIRSDIDVRPVYTRLLKTYVKNYIPEILFVVVFIFILYTKWTNK